MSSIISEINNEEDNSLTPQEIADSKIKIILSKSINNEETFLHFSYVKLYIAYEPNSEFEFTNALIWLILSWSGFGSGCSSSGYVSG